MKEGQAGGSKLVLELLQAWENKKNNKKNRQAKNDGLMESWNGRRRVGGERGGYVKAGREKRRGGVFVRMAVGVMGGEEVWERKRQSGAAVKGGCFRS